MGKNYAVMNAAKRLYDSGKRDSTKLTKETVTPNEMRESFIEEFGEENVKKYLDHFFNYTDDKFFKEKDKFEDKCTKGACCNNCKKRLSKGLKHRTGLKISQVQKFLDNLKMLTESHESVCKSQNVKVSKTKINDCIDYTAKVNFVCLDCNQSGSFLINEIKDHRLEGDANFVEFKCSSFSSVSELTGSEKKEAKKFS